MSLLIDKLLKYINALLEAAIPMAIWIVSIAFIMYIIIKFGNSLINKFVQRQVTSKTSFKINPQKAITLGEVLKSVLKYVVYFFGVGLMFYNFLSKIPVALASAGGFAIGLGAQSLVKDLINGFFILFEDQYGVGDHITLAHFTGIVESIGIRTTVLRDFTGDIHMIPNGAVLEITNHSRGDIRFIVDVDIAYEENIDQTINLIKSVNEKFEQIHKQYLRGEIEVLGVTSVNSSGVTIRVIGRSEPLKQWDMERELRKDIKVAISEAGIEIAYPKTQIVN